MLRILKLDWQFLTHKACALLPHANWPLLESLDLIDAELDRNCISHLVEANWPMLKVLDLSRNNLDLAACAYLAKGSWPQLERLCLRECVISDAGMKELAEGNWPLLKVLDVACYGVTHHGLRHLLDSNWSRLECLELPCQYRDDVTDLLSPGNEAGLQRIDNVVDNASLIAGGKWLRLGLLCFSDPLEGKVWFYDWGVVAPKSVMSVSPD